MASIKGNDYEAVVDWLFRQSDFLHDDKHYLVTVNALRDLIHQMSAIYSGYASKAAIKKFKGKLSLMTKEHYNPRQKMALKMVKQVFDGASKEEVIETLKEACKIHRVTSKENKALIPLQKEDNYIPEEAYRKVGIELVLHEGASREKEVSIERVKYRCAHEAAVKLNLGVQTVRNRIYSKSKKWAAWTYAKTS